MTTYYVSSSVGCDMNCGSADYPFQSIQRASILAQPGDTVLVQPGIYRERVAPPRGGISAALPIIYKSAVPYGAILRGSVPWVPTQQMSNQPAIWYDVLSPDLFPDGSAIDSPNPFRVPVSVTPYSRDGAPEYAAGVTTADKNMVYTLGQVFVNDTPYKQCPYMTEMTEGSWSFDMSSKKLYIYLSQGI